MPKLIVIIDDDDAMQESLHDLIEAAGLVARCFASAEEFLASSLHRQAACLITDILMPKMSGLQLQARLKEEQCDIPIIFITAHVDSAARLQAMREGAFEFLAKPFRSSIVAQNGPSGTREMSEQVYSKRIRCSERRILWRTMQQLRTPRETRQNLDSSGSSAIVRPSNLFSTSRSRWLLPTQLSSSRRNQYRQGAHHTVPFATPVDAADTHQ
jgi:FixJ family two-component response regulator